MGHFNNCVITTNTYCTYAVYCYIRSTGGSVFMMPPSVHFAVVLYLVVNM